jgi:ATP-binding cassette, subfamily B (MDR/TAP), member 1
MTLLFGALTQDFVNFSVVLEQANAGNTDAQAQLPTAAAGFRHAAAKDATWLVCIGEPN